MFIFFLFFACFKYKSKRNLFVYLCRPWDQFPLIRAKFGSGSTDGGLMPHATAAVCFVLFFFFLSSSLVREISDNC